MGSVEISSDRPVRDVNSIIENVVAHLTSGSNSQIKLTLKIDAEIPEGIDKKQARILNENTTTLQFIEKLMD